MIVMIDQCYFYFITFDAVVICECREGGGAFIGVIQMAFDKRIHKTLPQKARIFLCVPYISIIFNKGFHWLDLICPARNY